MKQVARTSKLIVVTNEVGDIRVGMWPGQQSEGAPSGVGLLLEDDQVAHEVDVPDELYRLAHPDLGSYYLRLEAGRRPELALRSTRL